MLVGRYVHSQAKGRLHQCRQQVDESPLPLPGRGQLLSSEGYVKINFSALTRKTVQMCY